MNLFFSRLLVVAGVLTFFSCSKTIEPNLYQEQQAVAGEPTQVGQKLNNPYSLANMRKAAAKMTQKRSIDNTDGAAIAEMVRPTHLYIKFTPKSWEEYDRLVALKTFEIYNYPLDVELIPGGTDYHAPSVPADRPTPQYASLPLATKPGVFGCAYQLLDTLCIPDEALEAESRSISPARRKAIIALVNTSMRLTGNEADTISTAITTVARRARYTPAGRVRVWDTRVNNYIPLRGVKINARRWFTTHTGYTDANGNYSVNGSFKRKSNYRLIFETGDFDVRSGTFGQAAIDGPKQKGNWNVDIRDGANRFYAHIFSAAVDYFNNTFGLNKPWFHSGLKPKLKIGAFYKNKDEDNGFTHPWTRPLGVLDVVRIYNPDRGSEAVYSTTIHELGHAAHWTHYRKDYKNANAKVAESWGRVVQWVFTNAKYSVLLNDPNFSSEEGLQWLDKSNTKHRSHMQEGYTPVGIDLIDNINQRATNEGSLNFANDNVSGFTILQIWQSLSGVRHLTQWRDRLKTFGVAPSADLDTLFEFYNNL